MRRIIGGEEDLGECVAEETVDSKIIPFEVRTRYRLVVAGQEIADGGERRASWLAARAQRMELVARMTGSYW